ncbi:MAG: hypothetical protein IJD39_04125 [Clostridia bacterium]|nr:hypothetical protein [Clostridia bacterium]
MTTRKFGRTALIAVLALSIVMSITGGTIAWFTDEVTSTGNVIEAGTLDVKLSAYDEVDKVWKEVTNNSAPLFDYDKWEPGYTAVKQLKIENAGNLAFKWHLNVKPALSLDMFEEDSQKMQDTITLAKAIDVYVAEAGTYTSFAELKAASEVYNLYDLAEASQTDDDGAAYGIMKVGDPAIAMTVALHMKEEAGNECQGLSISDGFVIQLRATQATVEFDSFGDDYDADAKNDLPSAFVKTLPASDLENVDLVGWGGSMSDETEVLNTGYLFATTDLPTELENNTYSKWHADYIVTFDRDVNANVIGLAGTYPGWGSVDSWLGFDLSQEMIKIVSNNDNATYLKKGTPVRLLGQAAAAVAPVTIPTINYEELCGGVGQFLCGAYDIDEAAAAGMKMTVELRLFETEKPSPENDNSTNVETGKYITIGVFEYTFPAASTNP